MTSLHSRLRGLVGVNSAIKSKESKENRSDKDKHNHKHGGCPAVDDSLSQSDLSQSHDHAILHTLVSLSVDPVSSSSDRSLPRTIDSNCTSKSSSFHDMPPSPVLDPTDSLIPPRAATPTPLSSNGLNRAEESFESNYSTNPLDSKGVHSGNHWDSNGKLANHDNIDGLADGGVSGTEYSKLSRSKLSKWKDKARDKALHTSEKLMAKASEFRHTHTVNPPCIGSKKSANNVSPTRIFGVPLATAVAESLIDETYPLPAVVIRSIEFLEAKGMYEVGLYRVPGSSSSVSRLKSVFNTGADLNLFLEDPPLDPNAVATLLKQFLREMPENILGPFLPNFMEILATESHPIPLLAALARQLPLPNYYLLSWLCAHLARLAYFSDVNKMTLKNLALIFSWTLQLESHLLTTLVSHALELFPLNSDGQIPDDVYRDEEVQSDKGISEPNQITQTDPTVNQSSLQEGDGSTQFATLPQISPPVVSREVYPISVSGTSPPSIMARSSILQSPTSNYRTSESDSANLENPSSYKFRKQTPSLSPQNDEISVKNSAPLVDYEDSPSISSKPDNLSYSNAMTPPLLYQLGSLDINPRLSLDLDLGESGSEQEGNFVSNHGNQRSSSPGLSTNFFVNECHLDLNQPSRTTCPVRYSSISPSTLVNSTLHSSVTNSSKGTDLVDLDQDQAKSKAVAQGPDPFADPL